MGTGWNDVCVYIGPSCGEINKATKLKYPGIIVNSSGWYRARECVRKNLMQSSK